MVFFMKFAWAYERSSHDDRAMNDRPEKHNVSCRDCNSPFFHIYGDGKAQCSYCHLFYDSSISAKDKPEPDRGWATWERMIEKWKAIVDEEATPKFITLGYEENEAVASTADVLLASKANQTDIHLEYSLIIIMYPHGKMFIDYGADDKQLIEKPRRNKRDEDFKRLKELLDIR